MFGLSFGEMVVVVLVAIVVVGPRHLPSMMRTAGQWVTRIRRMSTDLRAQSGIDQLLREEGIDRSIQEIRALSNVNVLDGLEKLAVPTAATTSPATAAATVTAAAASAPLPSAETVEILREREYPRVGCDAYDAMPDDAAPYVDGQPEPLAHLPLGVVATDDPTSRVVTKEPSAAS
ncbi:Sec-independent protein translocase protein TatB [Polyangium jinanense]|uniref:Twin-arginine translocase subunit TatB n=1 Tax=Polyangium jinanense TaxID=2829994 RepID=A0A9X3XAL8_9BACT|nr:Sec-independent protein translocase protein TatB [Polyangium jinanense]MDC3958756.1 twin-arginine translocase subunit TatB [Polyangium jinanense]MDC3985263.1 twin-arginine translocase subunit TatB [Polyangium jinanense]